MAKEARDEFLPEKMSRSWVRRLKNFFVRVMARYGRIQETHASVIAELLRTDAWMKDSENDGDRGVLRSMGIVASEGRIDGEVVTGNPDSPDQNPPLLYELNYSSKNQKKSRIEVYTVDAGQLCWLQL